MVQILLLQWIYWVTHKLPQIRTVILRICIGKVAWSAVYICGNFWVTQYGLILTGSESAPLEEQNRIRIQPAGKLRSGSNFSGFCDRLYNLANYHFLTNAWHVGIFISCKYILYIYNDYNIVLKMCKVIIYVSSLEVIMM